MKILMINKFLYPNGGSETYIFKLGEYLVSKGHEVEYFGMEHEGRCVGNRVGAYTSNMDFHDARGLEKISYAFRTIYSSEARKKIRMVLDDFQPDVCHLNNFNYQLTPSIILEIKKWSKETGKDCRIVYTAHDYQLVCPNHMCNNPNILENCEKCLGGGYLNCTKGKCVHGSTAKSLIGSMEAITWNSLNVYDKIDKIVCCSEFMKSKLDTNKTLAKKTIAIHNFVNKERKEREDIEEREDREEKGEKGEKGYILYFGRYSKEKGINTLIEVCKELPEIKFKFAGKGDDNILAKIKQLDNVEELGFLSGDTLDNVISNAKASIYPSEWYENCPFSVIESQILGTPVIGANIGGIPELVDNGYTGFLFEAGNKEDLKQKILDIYGREDMSEHCLNKKFMSIQEYYEKIMEVYRR